MRLFSVNFKTLHKKPANLKFIYKLAREITLGKVAYPEICRDYVL